MISGDNESPIEAILARAKFLSLNKMQKEELKRLDIDYKKIFLELNCRRDILYLENQSLDRIAPQELRSIDDLTIEIRQSWFRFYKKGLALLSDAQRLEFVVSFSDLPGFESRAQQDSVNVYVQKQVDEILNAKLKDAKVLELETAQAIVERISIWAKTAAIFTGVPLGVVAIVLGLLGINSYSDFKARVLLGKTSIDQTIKNAQASMEKSQSQAEALRIRVDKYDKDFQNVFALIDKTNNNIDRLKTKVDNIDVAAVVERYRSYLVGLGYKAPGANLQIEISDDDLSSAYYDGSGTIVVGSKIVNMPEVIYHEYTERALAEMQPASWSAASMKVQAIINGIADYLSCSYIGETKFGVKYVEEFKSDNPGIFKNDYLRNMENNRKFVEDGAPIEQQEPHAAGEVWSGLFWDIRRIFGCKDYAGMCLKADGLILNAWKGLDLKTDHELNANFARVIIDLSRKNTSERETAEIKAAFTARGINL